MGNAGLIPIIMWNGWQHIKNTTQFKSDRRLSWTGWVECAKSNVGDCITHKTTKFFFIFEWLTHGALYCLDSVWIKQNNTIYIVLFMTPHEKDAFAKQNLSNPACHHWQMQDP